MDVQHLIPAEAEKAVVGALLLDPTRIRETIPHVAPGDFHSTTLGRLYNIITSRHGAGHPVDVLTIWAAVQEDATLARSITSAAHLHDLMEATPTAANVGYYARQVAEAGQSRRLAAASARLGQLATDTSITAAEKLTAARAELDAIASDYATAIDVPTLADVLAVDDTHDWVIPGLLERMDRLVVTGGEGLGKSTLLRQIAILAAAGLHPTTFRPIDPVRVTVIDAENTERQWRRAARGVAIKAAQATGLDPAPLIRLHCSGRIDITKERDVAAIHSILDQHPTDLLMIGPLYKLTPHGLNKEDDAARIIATLDVIRERGITLLMEAHAGKALDGAGNRNMAPRGSSALLGWPEFGVGLSWDTSMLQGPSDTPTIVNLGRWRGDREGGRALPDQMRKGGHWPWMPVNTRTEWSPSQAAS